MFIIEKGEKRFNAKMRDLNTKGRVIVQTESVYKEDVTDFEKVYQYLVVDNYANAHSHIVEEDYLLNEVRKPLTIVKEGNLVSKLGMKIPFKITLDFSYTWRGFKCRYQFDANGKTYLFDSFVEDMENNIILEDEMCNCTNIYTKDKYLWLLTYMSIMKRVRYEIEDTDVFQTIWKHHIFTNREGRGADEPTYKNRKNIYEYMVFN